MELILKKVTTEEKKIIKIRLPHLSINYQKLYNASMDARYDPDVKITKDVRDECKKMLSEIETTLSDM